MIELQKLLEVMIEKKASDLHITTGSPPQFRIDGRLMSVDSTVLVAPDTKRLCYSVLTDAQRHKFEEETELDFSFGIKGLSRFRGNIYMQRGAVAGAFRAISFDILAFSELGVPPIVNELIKKPKGLVLVTGPTGTGKSTTLAAMIDKINNERNAHIITIEDPIEYLHRHKNCIVNQREVNSDTKTFGHALRHVLRQDPDIILIGEMRDLETIQAALLTAETGHLTFATLHTNSCVETINRVIDVFPPHQQQQVRTQLSFVLEGVLSQQLLPKIGGKGRALAMEVLIPNPAIRNLIREDKIQQLYSLMQVGQAKFGMQTMNQALLSLVERRLVSLEDATERSHNLEEFRQMLSNSGILAGKREKQARTT
ncbi:MAG: type IV pilus twitching motility protein PilT [Deltaproteobacteria bacterium]|nr:type IV pilus twitching motility protein PilT [Deltaproteobacteria bacterium]MBM4323380.1 type IV pilus twitching motility protein PilT [Deltaproteobacteria bacterium]